MLPATLHIGDKSTAAAAAAVSFQRRWRRIVALRRVIMRSELLILSSARQYSPSLNDRTYRPSAERRRQGALRGETTAGESELCEEWDDGVLSSVRVEGRNRCSINNARRPDERQRVTDDRLVETNEFLDIMEAFCADRVIFVRRYAVNCPELTFDAASSKRSVGRTTDSRITAFSVQSVQLNPRCSTIDI